MAGPATDLAAFINGSSGLVSGTNLFEGPRRAVGTGMPCKAVFVVATGGYAPVPFQDSSGQEFCIATVQVTVRGDAQSYASALALAQAVRNRVHHAAVPGYVETRVREPEPLYLGQDESAAHMHALNVEMEYRR